MTMSSGWIPVGLSASFEQATSTGTHIDGKELVVWRDQNGRAHVWEDRCPHRGMRLSFGFVRGDHIACLYHGWQFNAEGQCQYIPAHPQLDVPGSIKVPRYDTAESAGMIWTRFGADETENLPTVSDDCLPVRSLYLEASADEVWELLSGRSTVSRLAPNLWLAKITTNSVFIGMQTMSETRLGLHFTLVAPENQKPQQVQIQMLNWIREFRFAIETINKPPKIAVHSSELEHN